MTTDDLLTRQIREFTRHLPDIEGDLEVMPQHAESADRGPKAKYFSIRTLRRRPETLIKHIRKRLGGHVQSFWIGRATVHTKRNPRSCEANAARCFAFVADFDKFQDVQALLDHLDALGIPRPNLLVASGGGLHAYWHLSTPIPASLARKIHTDFLRRIDHPALDGSSDEMTRCFRPPGAPNPKHDCCAEIIQSKPGLTFDIDDLVPGAGATLPSDKEMNCLVSQEREGVRAGQHLKRKRRRDAEVACRREYGDLAFMFDRLHWKVSNRRIKAKVMEQIRAQVGAASSIWPRSRRKPVATPAAPTHPSRGPAQHRAEVVPAALPISLGAADDWRDIAPERIEHLSRQLPVTGEKMRHNALRRLIYRIRKVGNASLETALVIHDRWYANNAIFVGTAIDVSRNDFEQMWLTLPHLHTKEGFLDLVAEHHSPHPGLHKIDEQERECRGKRGRKRDYMALKQIASFFYSAYLVHPEGKPWLSIRTIHQHLITGTEREPSSCVQQRKMISLRTVANYVQHLGNEGLLDVVGEPTRPADETFLATRYTIPEKWRVQAPGSACAMTPEELTLWQERVQAKETAARSDAKARQEARKKLGDSASTRRCRPWMPSRARVRSRVVALRASMRAQRAQRQEGRSCGVAIEKPRTKHPVVSRARHGRPTAPSSTEARMRQLLTHIEATPAGREGREPGARERAGWPSSRSAMAKIE